ncbi:DUF6998 domain-containing protein [Olleya namhaensis]|uniref:DUF6998 domain-containing protein n=1 Tax=Olleya namhaensis TaxID=1144750 RepID=UPI00249223C5|nr:hypothetical protein [Olleya namhaensis]
MIEKENIESFYNKYFEILKLEIKELGCKPTELRHLIGRLGEFYCVIKTNGKLAHTPNQHGFDVIAENGKKISVKTTTQKSGFVLINKKTMALFDELMVLQLVDLEFKELYYGTMKEIEPLCRVWKGNLDKYELDLSKLKTRT